MKVFGVVSGWRTDPGNPTPTGRAGGLSCLLISAVLSVLVAAPGSAFAASSSENAASNRESTLASPEVQDGVTSASSSEPFHKGLGPQVAVPPWAKNEHVHFFGDLSASSSPKASQSEQTTGGQLHRNLGRRCDIFYCPKPPLLYHTGKGLQHSPAVHVIFWGSNWNKAPGAEVKTQLLNMLTGLSGSAWQGILTQYFDSTGRISSTLTVDSYVDTTAAAPTSVNDAKIKEEVAAAVTAKSWKREFSSQFVVIPAPGSTFEKSFLGGFCGYHGVDSSGSSYTFDAYVGEEPFKAGCIGFDPKENAGNVTSMIASHEYAESATDPQVEPFSNAEWYTSDEYEIADICASGDDQLPNGSWVQGLWDDHLNECSLSDKEPPHVYAITEPASNVTRHAASLPGTVNPEGVETKYYFEYGPTTSYGTKTSEVSAGSSTTNQQIYENISGLTLGTTYHYRIAGTNSTGTSYGEDRTFVPSNWSQQPTPNQAGAEFDNLQSVSCVSQTTCMAVGYDGYPEALLALRWNGTEWLQTVPSPKSVSVFRAVSCSSSTFCEAVGRDSENKTLAQRWNGTEWSAQSIPTPGGEYTALKGISCASTSFCIAVGEEGSPPQRMFAERWNGTEWTIEHPTAPPETNGTSLYGVSCPTATSCTAVGFYGNKKTEGREFLIEHWNGTEWSRQEVSPPAGATWNFLAGVSCTSTTACTAVGKTTTSGIKRTAAVRWNGTAWALQTMPKLSESVLIDVTLNGVSCASSTSCNAAGEIANTALMEHWNGTEWMVESTPSLEGFTGTGNSFFQGVSCATSTYCTTVGSYFNPGHRVTLAESNTLAPHLETRPATGVNFTEATLRGSVNPEGAETKYYFEYGPTTAYGTKTTETSAGSGTANLNESKALTALTPETTYHFRIVASSANGTSVGADRTFATPGWTVQASPNPEGAKESELEWLSCTSSTNCESVGYYKNSSGVVVTLAERLTTLGWSIQATPNPEGSTESRLEGVSCTSSSSCEAVGVNGKNTLAEVWNGTEWKIQTIPNPEKSESAHLYRVSCASSTACEASGYFIRTGGHFEPLTESWNGTKWEVQSTPNPEGGEFTYLIGDSCPATTSCEAVGADKGTTHGLITLAEHWNGTKWEVQSTPNPEGFKESEFYSVSCSSTTNCEAVGRYLNSSTVWVTLAEHWNGTKWEVQSTPNPEGAKEGVLIGTSCTSSTYCEATGYYKNSSGVLASLAEHWDGSKWEIQPTPTPEGAKESFLEGISCTATALCSATGAYKNSAGVFVTLAEGY